jgi:sulfur-oxidizing protein SoxX
MQKTQWIAAAVLAIGTLSGTASAADKKDTTLHFEGKAELVRTMAVSLNSKGPATLDGVLQQDSMQALCSNYPDASRVPKAAAKQLQAEQLKLVKYPADSKYLGDWKEGEKIAQLGRGMQFSDKAGSPNGGNCYACHEMTKAEISFGNIGPSLYHYGKLRGNSEAILKYTWSKIYNSNAYNACSNMPRFGHKNILTEQQIRDVMALLLDPASPVNQ